MLSITAPQLALFQKGHRNHYAWIETQNSDGVWKDMTALSGSNFMLSGNLQWNQDSNVATGTLSLRRSSRGNSISPLMTGSLINRNALGSYAPLIDVNRRIRVKVALTDNGVAPAAGDIKEIFTGYTGDVQMDGKSSETISIPITDLGKLLVITNVNLERQYGSASGTSVETVMQQILDDNLGAGVVTLYTPTSPGWMIHQFQQDINSNLLDALNALAQQIGYTVRYKYDNTGTSRLTFFAQDRTKSTIDATISPSMYQDVQSLDIVDADIRNDIEVVYIDRTTGTQVIARSTDTMNSQARYGKRFMRIGEAATSQIDTAGEANTLIAAAYNDLAFPSAIEAIVMPAWWVGELGDRYTFKANGDHYDQDQNRSITGIALAISNGTITATLTGKEQPTGLYSTYLNMATDQVSAAMATGTVRITAADATSVTVAVDTTTVGSQVMLDNLMGGGTLLSGPAIGTPSATGTVWKFQRSMFGTGSGVAVFRILANGLPYSDIAFAIDEQGRDTVSLALSLQKISETPTTLTMRATVADPYPQGAASVILTYVVYGTGTVTPNSGQYLGTSADGATRVITTSLGTSGYVDFIIPKPAITAAGHARVVFTATGNARVSPTASVDIPTQGYVTPTPRPTFTEDDTANTASVTLTLNDPQSHATSVRFTSWSGRNTPVVTTVAVGVALTASVALVEKITSHIMAEIIGTDATGATGIVLDTDTYDFNAGARPVLQKPDSIIAADGTVTALFSGDNDTYRVYAKLYAWNNQNAPTILNSDVLATSTQSTNGVRKGSIIMPGTIVPNRKYTLAFVAINSSYDGASMPKPFSTYGDVITTDLFWSGIGATPDPAISFRNIAASATYVDLDVVFNPGTQSIKLYRQIYTGDPAASSPANSAAAPMPPSVETTAAEEWNDYSLRETTTDGGGVQYVRVRVPVPGPSTYGVLTAIAFDPQGQRATPTASDSIKLLTAAAPPGTVPPTPTIAAQGTSTSNAMTWRISNLHGTGATPTTARLYMGGNAYKDYAVTSGNITAGYIDVTTNADLTPGQNYVGSATLLAGTVEGVMSGTANQSTQATGGGGSGGTGGNGNVPTPTITGAWSQADQVVYITITPGAGTPAGTLYAIKRATNAGMTAGVKNGSPNSSLVQPEGEIQSATVDQYFYYTVVASCSGYGSSAATAALAVEVPHGNYGV